MPGAGYSLQTANTAAARSNAGPITVGGLTFGPSQHSQTLMAVGLVAVAAIAVLLIFRKELKA